MIYIYICITTQLFVSCFNLSLMYDLNRILILNMNFHGSFRLMRRKFKNWRLTYHDQMVPVQWATGHHQAPHILLGKQHTWIIFGYKMKSEKNMTCHAWSKGYVTFSKTSFFWVSKCICLEFPRQKYTRFVTIPFSQHSRDVMSAAQPQLTELANSSMGSSAITSRPHGLCPGLSASSFAEFLQTRHGQLFCVRHTYCCVAQRYCFAVGVKQPFHSNSWMQRHKGGGRGGSLIIMAEDK